VDLAAETCPTPKGRWRWCCWSDCNWSPPGCQCGRVPYGGLLKSGPTLLVRRGRMLPEAMRQQRVTAGEIRQAVRSQGIGGPTEVAEVVLEIDGTFSVITSSQAGDGSALRGVQGFAADRDEAPGRPGEMTGAAGGFRQGVAGAVPVSCVDVQLGSR
jgi:hypothetical protein